MEKWARLAWAGIWAATIATSATGVAKADGDLVTVVSNVNNITTETFSSTSGDVADGCITPGTHRVMRFDFSSRNVGDGNVIAGTVPPRVCTTCPCSTSPTIGSYIWSNAHCHWHLKDFNKYVLTRTTGVPAANGFKQAFCLEDFTKWDPSVGGAVFNCSNQGVSPGWQDTYVSSLPCQFMNVDGVGNGDYRLVATTNAAPTVIEANIHNNSVDVPLRISGNTVSLLGGAWQPRESQTSAGTTFLPALTSWGPNRLDAFWTNPSDGRLKHHWKDSGSAWSTQEDLGAPAGVSLTTSPSAVAWAPNRLDIVALGSDGRLWHTYYANGWGGWDNPGGASGVQSVPTVISWGPNRLDIFWIDTSSNLRHIAWAGTFWGGVDNLGHPSSVSFSSQVRAVSWGVNRLDIVARGSDSRLWHQWWNGSSWGSWDNPAGASTVAARPDIVSWQPGRLDIFWPSTASNAIQHTSYQGVWNGIDTLTGPAGTTITGWPSVVAWGPNRLDIFVKGSDSRLWHNWWGGGWGFWETPYTNNDLVSSPTATSWANGELSIIFGTTGGNLGSVSYF